MPALPSFSTGPRVFPRLKAVWSKRRTINAQWRLGLFGFYERVHGFPRSGFAISVRGAMAWSGVFAVISYLAFAAAATHWFRRNPYNTIQFLDVLTWPVRREHVARQRAQAWLAQGRAAMHSGRWGEATFYLRRGLDMVPDDFESRAILASFYVAVGDRTQGLTLIEEGLAHGMASQSQLEASLNVAAAGEDWDLALRICDRAQKHFQKAARWTDGQWLLSRKLSILNQIGRAAEALPLAEVAGENVLVPVKLERARALVALGRPSEADLLLTTWRKNAAADDARLLLREQINVRREAGDFSGMDQLLAELRVSFPGRPEPLVRAVEMHARAHRDAASALEDYIFRFGASAENLMLVARPLATIPNFALLLRIIEAARERGFDTRSFRILLAEAKLSRGDTTGFINAVEEVQKLPKPAGREPGIWLQWSRLLVDALTSPHSGPADPLVVYVRGHPISLEAHRMMSAALQRAGKLDTAREVLATGRRIYPASSSLAAEQNNLDTLLATAAAKAAAAPAAAVVNVAEDWNAFAGPLEIALQARRWEEARRIIRQLRGVRPAPAWLAAREPELLWHELRVAHELADPLGLQLASRAYVNGSVVRADKLLALAREWQNAGSSTHANLIVRVVLEKSPDYEAAKNLLPALTKKAK